MDSIKDVVRSSVTVPEFDKHLRTYRPKRCGNNNKDEDNSPKTLNDKNQQTSSQKFRQRKIFCFKFSFILFFFLFSFDKFCYFSHFIVFHRSITINFTKNVIKTKKIKVKFKVFCG